MSVPEISVQEVAAKRQRGDLFILLDVREAMELNYAHLREGVTAVALSDIADQGLGAFPPSISEDQNVEIVVMCHHGNRSAQVANWLQQQGWLNVFNMTGGIDAYALEIDPTIGRY